MRVLVLDDPEIARTVCDVLTDRGHDAFTADPAGACGERIATTLADAVILDVRPYDLFGIELAERIRRTSRRIPIRLIGFGVSFSILESAGKAHLFDACLPKPVTIEAIEAALGIDTAMNTGSPPPPSTNTSPTLASLRPAGDDAQ